MAQVTRPSRGGAKPQSGRPSTYRERIAEDICDRLAHGESLRTICQDDDLPHRTTVLRWLARHEVFRARYEVARQIQADVWRDEIYDLAKAEPVRDPRTGRIDQPAMMHRRNQIGTLRWLAVKHNPRGRVVDAIDHLCGPNPKVRGTMSSNTSKHEVQV